MDVAHHDAHPGFPTRPLRERHSSTGHAVPDLASQTCSKGLAHEAKSDPLGGRVRHQRRFLPRSGRLHSGPVVPGRSDPAVTGPPRWSNVGCNIDVFGSPPQPGGRIELRGIAHRAQLECGGVRARLGDRPSRVRAQRIVGKKSLQELAALDICHHLIVRCDARHESRTSRA